MKYLKTYESQDPIDETLKDICLDLEDDGYSIIYSGWRGELSTKWGVDNHNVNRYLFISKSGMKIDEIEGTLQRIKNFLGDNFHHFAYVVSPVDRHKYDLSLNPEVINSKNIYKGKDNIFNIYIFYTNKYWNQISK